MPLRPNTFQIYEQGKLFSNPTTQHSTAQHSGVYHCCVYANTSRQCPTSEKAGKKETQRRTVFLPFSFNASGNGKPQRHAPGPGMQDEKTNKLKSTSEVTLQDINLEVYWQRGKRPGLVHGRDTLAEHPPAGNWLQTRDRWGGGIIPGDHDTPTPRLASSDISLFKSLYLVEQVDTV